MNIAKHLGDLGIEEEFGNHAHMRGLSGGQKVKVVLAAATWLNPHIIVLVKPCLPEIIWQYSRVDSLSPSAVRRFCSRQ